MLVLFNDLSFSFLTNFTFFSATHLANLPFSDFYLSKIEDHKIKFCWCYFISCCSTLPTSQFQFLPEAYQWMSGARLSSVVWRIGKVLRWTPSCLPLHASLHSDSINHCCSLCCWGGSGQTAHYSPHWPAHSWGPARPIRGPTSYGCLKNVHK